MSQPERMRRRLYESNSEVRAAEESVKQSTAEFEQAMGHLEETVEDRARRARRVIENVKRPIGRVRTYMEQTREKGYSAMNQARERGYSAMNRARNTASNLTSNVRSNPTPYGIGAVSLAALGLISALFIRQRRQGSARPRVGGVRRGFRSRIGQYRRTGGAGMEHEREFRAA